MQIKHIAMRKIIFLLIFLPAFVFAQTDSTTIRLQHYKDLFVQGLISSQEYEILKQKELKLSPANTTIVPAVVEAALAPKPEAKQKIKRKFSIDSIKPGVVSIVELGPVFGITNKAPAAAFGFKAVLGKRTSIKSFWGAGLAFEVSTYNSPKTTSRNPDPNLRENYLIAGKATYVAASAIGAFRYSFLAKKTSPFIGVDLGATYYTVRIPRSKQNNLLTYTDDGYSNKGGGARLTTIFGFQGYVSQKARLGLSLNYTLQHYQMPDWENAYSVDGSLHKGTITRFFHFLGLSFVLTFG